MKPKISIVVACYNEEDRIGRCLETLLNQTVKPHEIIVVDGGSKDSTVSVIENFKKRSKKVKLLHEKGRKRSPANARNVGWKAASGNYILFLDADGEFEKNFIEVVESSILDKKTEKKLIIKHSVIDSWKEVFLKYSWYGRTMMKYWLKNKMDYKILVRAALSLGIIILPFLIWNECLLYLFLINIVLILGLGIKTAVSCYRNSGIASFIFSIPLYMIFIFVSTGIGLLSVPLLLIFGKYNIGR